MRNENLPQDTICLLVYGNVIKTIKIREGAFVFIANRQTSQGNLFYNI